MAVRPGASLRTKITLALLVTGLTSAVLVGVIARFILLDQFNGVVQESSFQAFHGDMTAYIETYGSFEAAWQAEPFPQFAARRRATVPGPSRRGVGAGGAGLPPQPGRGGPPPRAFAPPFLFMLIDLDGRVLQGPTGEFPLGTVVPEPIRTQARPVVVHGETVALAVPLAQPNLTQYDESYLAATQNAVRWGVLGAAALALGLGFFFSHRLSANLRTLTRAMQGIERGELQQHVRVRTRDEVGFLAETFNRMSATIREQAERLQELAIRDEVTRLHNRRHFDDQAAVAFSQAQRYGRPFSVAIADVDHFKQINDRFSHATGDAVLAEVAQILASGRRESDIVARYGGEEFVLAFPETSLADATATCERIRREIADFPWDAVHPELEVTITIGLDADLSLGSLDEMLKAADARLYEGKQSGRNRVCSPATPSVPA